MRLQSWTNKNCQCDHRRQGRGYSQQEEGRASLVVIMEYSYDTGCGIGNNHRSQVHAECRKITSVDRMSQTATKPLCNGWVRKKTTFFTINGEMVYPVKKKLSIDWYLRATFSISDDIVKQLQSPTPECAEQHLSRVDWVNLYALFGCTAVDVVRVDVITTLLEVLTSESEASMVDNWFIYSISISDITAWRLYL